MRKLTRILLSALVLVMIFSVSVASAQDDGLTDDELAILERILELDDVIDGYESFVVDYVSINSTTQDMNFGVMAMASSSIVDVSINATVIRGDSVNVAATITSNVENFEDEIASAYTIEAEARYVDEVLYVNILDIQGVDGAEAPEAPEGWQVVDEFLYPFYADLGLGDFTDAVFDTAMDEEDEVDFVEILETAATSITVEEDEIDGVAVDVITVTVGFEGLQALMAEEIDPNDPMTTALFGMLSEQGDLVTYSMAVDADDNILGVAVQVSFNLEEIDLSQFDASLEGATMAFAIEQTEISQFSQINESFEPVEAP